MKRSKNLHLMFILLFTLGIPPASFVINSPGQTAGDPANKLTEVEVKQESLRTTTQRVNNQLALIVEEFERNSISGEDVQVLKSLQSVLDQLSEKEMFRIIALLQEARLIHDPTTSRQRMLEAFTGQKSIMIKLKQLLDEFKRQKELYELSILFNRLAEKQNANLKEAVALEPILQGRTIDKLTETQKVPLQVQATEQQTIRDETLLGLSKLQEVAYGETTKTTEQAINALKYVTNSNLKVALSDAIEDLKMARLYSAIGNEKRIRDTLRELARQLIPPAETVEAMKQALRELENLIAEQKSILKQTEDLKQNNRTLDNNREIAARQLELSDKADSLRQILKNTAPMVAENLKDSINKMHETHAILNANDGRWRAADAISKEKEALKTLEKARDELTNQIASMERENLKPLDPISQLKDLIGRVENLINQQTNLAKASLDYEKNNQIGRYANELAQKQSEIKQETQAAQADSAPISPKAAEELNNAAEQMGRAEKSFAKGKNDPFSLNYAAESLKKAADELKRNLAEKEKATGELAGIERALNKLSDIIQDQQDVNKETARYVGTQSANPQKMQSVSRKQANAADKTSSLQSEVSPIIPAASQALSKAADSMRQSESALAKASPSTAIPAQSRALDNLYRAKDAMEDRAAELRQQLGMPTVAQTDLAKASEMLNQAQEQLNSALNELLPAGILDELTRRQKELAGNIARMISPEHVAQKSDSRDSSPPSNISSSARQNLEKAGRSASEAAKQLAASDVKGAVNAMRQAENALKEAAKTSGGLPQSAQISGRNTPDRQASGVAGEQLPARGQSGADQQTQPSATTEQNYSGNNSQGIESRPQTAPGKNAKTPSIEELGNEQSVIRELAEQYLNTIEPQLNSALARAAQSLNSASAIIGTLSASASGMPQAAREPLRRANSELMNAVANASGQKPATARQHALTAQESLAQAEAALAIASNGKPIAQMGTNQQSEQNQGGQNTGQSSSNAQSGTPNTGQGHEGNVSGMGSSQQRAAGQMGRSQGTSGNWYGPGGDKGARISAEGGSKFIGLPKRERDAILQSQSEKYPPDYASFIEQYMKNLSDEATLKK